MAAKPGPDLDEFWAAALGWAREAHTTEADCVFADQVRVVLAAQGITV